MQEKNNGYISHTSLWWQVKELGISQTALLNRMNAIIERDIQLEAISMYPKDTKSHKVLREAYVNEHKRKTSRGNHGINNVVGVTRVTLYNAIYGKGKNGVSNKTAYLILEAINQVRLEKGMSKLELSDIGLSVFKRWE